MGGKLPRAHTRVVWVWISLVHGVCARGMVMISG